MFVAHNLKPELLKKMPGKLKPVIVPLLPMREEIVFPGTTAPFFVGRQSSMDALDRALSLIHI